MISGMDTTFINNAPKNIKTMKETINAASVKDFTLAQKLEKAVGFEIRWQRLNIVQANLVWLAWCAYQGNQTAALMLALLGNNEQPEPG